MWGGAKGQTSNKIISICFMDYVTCCTGKYSYLLSWQKLLENTFTSFWQIKMYNQDAVSHGWTLYLRSNEYSIHWIKLYREFLCILTIELICYDDIKKRCWPSSWIHPLCSISPSRICVDTGFNWQDLWQHKISVQFRAQLLFNVAGLCEIKQHSLQYSCLFPVGKLFAFLLLTHQLC